MEQIVGIAYGGQAGHDAGKVDRGVLEALMFGKSDGHPPESRPAASGDDGFLEPADPPPSASNRPR